MLATFLININFNITKVDTVQGKQNMSMDQIRPC